MKLKSNIDREKTLTDACGEWIVSVFDTLISSNVFNNVIFLSYFHTVWYSSEYLLLNDKENTMSESSKAYCIRTEKQI